MEQGICERSNNTMSNETKAKYRQKNWIGEHDRSGYQERIKACEWV